MPIRIQNDLPAREILDRENIFVMREDQADVQEIRPGASAASVIVQYSPAAEYHVHVCQLP